MVEYTLNYIPQEHRFAIASWDSTDGPFTSERQIVGMSFSSLRTASKSGRSPG